MPQIWPMNWVMLFVFFTLVFYVFLNLIYFTTEINLKGQSNDSLSSSPAKPLNWKW